jgi:lipoprotein NlpD
MGRLILSILVLLLAACGSRPPVPVSERTAPVLVEGAAAPAAAPAAPRPGYYIVKKGDTLLRIAREHAQDWREMAAWNNLTDPGRLEVGQELRVLPPEGQAVVKPIALSAPVVVSSDPPPAKPAAAPPASAAPLLVPPPGEGEDPQFKRFPKGGKLPYSEQALAQVKAMERNGQPPAKPVEKAAEPAPPAVATGAVAAAPVPGAEKIDWTWPAAGKVIGEFSAGAPGKESNKGIDLAGRLGEPIQAAAAGRVSYVGSLRGYGDFLTVRHDNDFISVYAHTSKIVVKAEQRVEKGQKIAEVGSSDTDQPKLHFEIRRQGTPVDPLRILPAR